VIVVYPGAPGAFAHAACRLLLPQWEAEALATFAATAHAVAKGDASAGVLPLHNSIAGEVPGVQQLITDVDLEIVASLDMPIRLHLLGRPGSRLDGIK
jgi:prephenate dehydratase